MNQHEINIVSELEVKYLKRFSVVYEILGGRKQEEVSAIDEDSVEYQLSQIDSNFIPESRWVRVIDIEEVS